MKAPLLGARLDVRLLIGSVLALCALHCADDDTQEDAGLLPSTAGTSPGPAGSSAQTAAVDTWNGYAQGFFASYCVSCHNDDQQGDASRDLHQRSVVDEEFSEIACGLSKSAADWSARGCTGFPPARQFPAGSGPKPSDAERDRLIAWIDAGRP